MESYLDDLNIDQKKAVTHINGPSMVIAGAGSGKTRVLIYKIAHLLHNNINPFHILALTFTNKAAKEMRSRIDLLLGNEQSKSLWMGTFHSIFSRILRIESEKINFPRNFTIYDTSDSKSLIKSIIKELRLDKDVYKVGPIQNRISSLKNNFITSKEYNNHPELIEADKHSKRTEFSTIYHTYVTRCFKSGSMDFDDILLNTYKLIVNHPDALYKYQKKFKYVLVDEYQDTNYIQYLIIKKLSALNQNLCVVGDDAQSIYAFRGANIQNILNFKIDYPEYHLFKLEQNYRSSKNIVNVANSLIKHNEKQIKKKVWTNNKNGDKVVICELGSDNDESRLVANTISALTKDNNYQNSAILYRTNSQSRSLEESLRKLSIPYKVYGGISFYQRKEIKDVLGYLRLTVNPNDEESLKRVINYPARGIGSTTLQKIIISATENNCSLWEIIKDINKYNVNLNSGTKNKIERFRILIESFSSQINKKDAYDLSEEIIKQSGIFQTLYNDKSIEGISRFENIQELLNGIKNFTEGYEGDDYPNIIEFMNEVSLITDIDLEKKEDYNKVTLMTIHASKGLEFPYIFVVGMEEGLFPSMMSSNSQEELEEERRLFYVAITRAKEKLFLSHCKIRFKWGQYIDSEPSRFLSDLDREYIENKNFSKEQNEISNPKYNKYKIFSNKSVKEPSKKFKKIQETRKHSKIINSDNISIETKVYHSIFGTGVVKNIEGKGINKKATVLFEKTGLKQLLLQFAKLKVIN